MPYYHVCPECGANLDPGEKCDCKENESDEKRGCRKQPPRKEDRELAINTTLKSYNGKGKFASDYQYYI